MSAGVPLTVSLSPDSHGPGRGWRSAAAWSSWWRRKRDSSSAWRIPEEAERVRVWEPISTAARAAANGAGLTVIDAPVLANGRLELRWYLREQTVSRVLHRYGSLMESSR